MFSLIYILFVFFFNDTATTEIYTLSLHDALPISWDAWAASAFGMRVVWCNRYDQRPERLPGKPDREIDRKSTRLNSSHLVISYAVFCLKKKKKIKQDHSITLQNINMQHIERHFYI